MNLMFFSRITSLRKNSRKGMNFAELLFAIAIVSTVLVTMIGTLSGGLEALQKSTAYNQATIIAQKTVEQYKAMHYADIVATDPNGVTTSDSGFIVNVKIIAGTAPLTPPVPFKKLTVNVSRTGVTGRDAAKKVNVTMESFFIQN